MTDKDLTAPEAVEKIAQYYDSDIEGCDPECAATLRALSAALEAEKARVSEWREEYYTERRARELYARKNQALIAEGDALKAELVEAVGLLHATTTSRVQDDLEWHIDARAFLARHQKETDT